jgi:hypothetical protein
MIVHIGSYLHLYESINMKENPELFYVEILMTDDWGQRAGVIAYKFDEQLLLISNFTEIYEI